MLCYIMVSHSVLDPARQQSTTHVSRACKLVCHLRRERGREGKGEQARLWGFLTSTRPLFNQRFMWNRPKVRSMIRAEYLDMEFETELKMLGNTARSQFELKFNLLSLGSNSVLRIGRVRKGWRPTELTPREIRMNGA